jgi:osmotically-inducible protein OsmY
MALKNTYSGRRNSRQQAEREFDNPMSYGTEDQKYRNYYHPDYDDRYRSSEQYFTKSRFDNYDDYQDEQRLESIYGGDERNYGNANQGSFDREWWERTRKRVAGWFGSDKEMDRKHHGQYGGIGPKNYKRNEQRIYEDVCDLLMENDGIDAGDIEVRVEGNYVILSGNVHTRSEKRRAEDIALSVTGVYDVENRLRIVRQDYLHS